MNAGQIALAVVLFIVAHRLLFFALNLIGIALFLVFVYLRDRLKRSRKSPHLGQQSNSGIQTSSSSLINNPGQRRSLEEQRTTTTGSLSVRNSQPSCIDIGFCPPPPVLTPNRSQKHLTVQSTDTESLTLSYRSESITSRPLPPVTRPLSGMQGSQPHRSSSGSILPDSNMDERHRCADTNSEHYLHSNGGESFPTAWSSSTAPFPNPNSEAPRPSIGISDIEFPTTPTSAAIVPDEDILMETPVARRFPTRDSMYTEKSIMTLPLYQENEDERMSITSRAPTYRSTIVPRESMPPLPIPPSIYLPTVVSNVSKSNMQQ